MSEFLAPNGNPSNLTPEQYKLVRTPEFKEWFGDWEKGIFTDYQKFIEYKHKIGTGLSNVVSINYICEEIDLPLAEKIKSLHKVAFDFLLSEYEMSSKNGYSIDFKKFITEFLVMYKPVFDLINILNTNPEIEITKKTLQIFKEEEFQKWVEYKNQNISKVVDENGEPLVVYHGTPRGDFNVFELKRNSTFGFYFSNQKENSKTYGNRIIPAFLKINNPLILDVRNKKFKEKIELPSSLISSNENQEKNHYLIDEIVLITKETSIYDGNIFKNFVDTSRIEDEPINQDTIVVFNSNQIKLADGTNTTFELNNPDIRYEKGGDISWDSNRYREVEKEMYELRENGKADTIEYFKLIKERAILEQSKMKKSENKYAKGGKIIAYIKDADKFKRIGIEDKYVIEAISEIGLQGINFNETTILNKIKNDFDELINDYESYIINQDSQSITNYMNNEIEAKREDGASLEVIEKMERGVGDVEERNKTINDIAEIQREAIKIWVDYLKSSEYSISFKYLMLKAVLNYNYDLKSNKLFQRNNETIRNFTPFDAGTLSQLNEMKSEYLLIDYNVLMNENSQKVLNSRDVVEESGDGKWLKFNGGSKTSDTEKELNAKELMQLVQNTYWCTKTNAKSQLSGGDFYVYVTENDGEIFPRIAVRMRGNEVGEVRGNRSSAQDLEDDMLPIAEDFLIKKIPNNSGIKWLNSIRYNKKCSDLRKRIEREGLFKDFIYEYIEVIADASKYNVDYGSNGNVVLLKELFNQKLKSLPNENYKQGDIVTEVNDLNRETLYFIGNLNQYDIDKLSINYGINLDFNTWKLKLISGDLQSSEKITTMGNLEMIGGTLNCSQTLNDFGKLKYIGGQLNLNDNRIITSLANIEYIGSNLTINNSKQNIKTLSELKKINGSLTLISCDETFDIGKLEHIQDSLVLIESNIDFKNIKKIDGSLNLKGSLISDLKYIQYVGGDLDISNSKVKVFENLKFIGGNVDFSNNFTSNTQGIETILGNVKFLNSRIMEFPNLKKIGGSIEFRGSFFKSFGNIKYIGGSINLAESKIEDLGELEYVGGYVNFKGTKIESLKKLKKIVSFVNFDGSNVNDLGDLESIGGNAYFNNSKITSLGKLKYVGGFVQFGNNLKLEKEWNNRNNG